MKRGAIGKTLTSLLVLLLLGMFASIPQAQATSLEAFPTTTSVVVEGWVDPENAYAMDGVMATSSTSVAQQNFAGFGFNFNETDTIDCVWLSIFGYGECGENLGGSSTLGFNAGNETALVDFGISSETSSFGYGGLSATTYTQNVTDIFGAVDQLNNVEVSVVALVIADANPMLYMDAIWLTVFYSTPAEPFNAASVFAGFLLLGLPLFTIALAKRKQDLDNAEATAQMRIEAEAREEENEEET